MTTLIIDVRITEYTLRKDNPNVPCSPEEIANGEMTRVEGLSVRVPKTLPLRFEITRSVSAAT